jgi:hypothetical protein
MQRILRAVIFKLGKAKTFEGVWKISYGTV